MKQMLHNMTKIEKLKIEVVSSLYVTVQYVLNKYVVKI